jgi:predicted metal-dependent phosphoesterase TrpH
MLRIPQTRYDLALLLDRLTIEGGVDLHLHSSCSDGAKTPQEVARSAKRNRLRAFALTDHDTMAGVVEAKEVAGDDILFFPGIECSAVDLGSEVHILGYFSRLFVSEIEAYLEERRRDRHDRNRRMLSKLRALGYPIDEDSLTAYGGKGNASVGRVHMALWLVDYGGCESISDAFRALLSEGRPAYVPRPRHSIREVTNVIAKAQGVAVLAHPAQYGWCRCPEHPSTRTRLLERIMRCKNAGIDGVECFHGEATEEERRLLFDVTTELDLIRTAGSDDHGRVDTHAPMYFGSTRFV